jgi:hypothetical protein
MARNAGVVVENNFTNGLVTEATGLSFPENAVTETDNCVFDPISIVSRRDGIDYESGHTTFATFSHNVAVVEYLWETVGGNGNLSVHVQQIGDYLYFFNVNSNTSLSSQLLQIMQFPFPTGPLDTMPAQFAHGLGRLIVTHPHCEPFYVEYNRDTGVFSREQILVYTRDFKGVEPHPVSRLDTITTEHRYNLFNQGWPIFRQQEFRGKAGYYPSDYEVWWLYKRPDQYGNEVFLPTDIFNWQTALDNLDRGNSPAPKGSALLYEFYQDRSGASNIPGLPVVTSGIYRPGTCAFHAGRVFYSGVDYEEFSSKVYFSQIVEGPKQFGKCHQENDPTSQYSSDLLPSDGGVISIPDVGTIRKLWSINNSLLVVGTNGVWEITGSSGIGFAATDYTVKKISSLATLSALSFVNVNGVPLWWGQDAILAASPGQTGSLSIQNISDAKIKSFFDDILPGNRLYVKGAYNSKEGLVQWVYRDGAAPPASGNYGYNRILNFNTRNQCFYPWTIPGTVAEIKGIFAVEGQGEYTASEAILNNASAAVTDNVLAPVTITTTIVGSTSSEFKYTTVNVNTFQWTFSEADIGVRSDWTEAEEGIPFTSYFVSGYKTRGNALTKTQTNYIRFFNNGEGLFHFWTRWDFANSASTGRWSSPQICNFDDGSTVDVQSRRKKIRGHGLTLQIVVQSFEDEDFNIIGWSTFDSSNARP